MSPGGGSTPAVSGAELRAQLVLPFLAVAVFQNPYALPSWERCKDWEIVCDLPSVLASGCHLWTPCAVACRRGCRASRSKVHCVGSGSVLELM